MNMCNIIRKNWYPGSAFASKEWISYLQKTFPGKWVFTDQNEFTEWTELRGERRNINTLEPLPDFIRAGHFDTLVISMHPGLRTYEQIIHSGILQTIKPRKLIFDPGSPQPGNIESHLREADFFRHAGYLLEKIVVLPHLLHQYCEFRKSDEDSNLPVNDRR